MDPRTQPPAVASYRIVVATGEPHTREALRRILAPRHRVATAPCRDGLHELLGRQRSDAVVLDPRLPGGAAGPWIARLRPTHPEVAWLAIASQVTLTEARDLLAAGVTELLPEPVDATELTAAVGRALRAQLRHAQLVGFLRALGGVVGCDRQVTTLIGAVEHDAPLRRQVGELVSWTSRRMIRVHGSRRADVVRGEGAAPGSNLSRAVPTASLERAWR